MIYFFALAPLESQVCQPLPAMNITRFGGGPTHIGNMSNPNRIQTHPDQDRQKAAQDMYARYTWAKPFKADDTEGVPHGAIYRPRSQY